MAVIEPNKKKVHLTLIHQYPEFIPDNNAIQYDTSLINMNKKMDDGFLQGKKYLC
jgi:hypothetical protein